MQKRLTGSIFFHILVPLAPPSRWWDLWSKAILPDNRWACICWGVVFAECIAQKSQKERLLKCVFHVFLGAESTADLPCGSNALLWQETWGFTVRLLPDQRWDPWSGLCHHIWYSDYSYSGLCAHGLAVSSVLFFLSIKGEVLKMLEEENVSLNDLESAAPDTMYVLFHFAFF